MGLNTGVIIYFSHYQLPIARTDVKGQKCLFSPLVLDKVSKLFNFQHNICTEHFYRTDTHKIKKTLESTAALKIHSQGTSQP
jgi:hypothetical protein